VRVYERFGTAWALGFSASRTGDTGTRSLAFDGVWVAARSGEEVLVFKDSASGFYLEETEADPDPHPGDQYGISVGLAGPTLVLSKPSSKRGWVYERNILQIYPGPW